MVFVASGANEGCIPGATADTLEPFTCQKLKRPICIPGNNLGVNVDEEAVSEAVINLIDNAMKYSRDKKEIEINTGHKKDTAFVEVKDYGIGISDEDQKKIFEKFYRVPTGLVHNVKGTGLGLTLVKQIMDHHKGKVELKSEVDKGSSFKLIFPFVNNNNDNEILEK